MVKSKTFTDLIEKKNVIYISVVNDFSAHDVPCHTLPTASSDNLLIYFPKKH